MSCNFFYPRHNKCTHLIETGGQSNLCRMSQHFLCTLGEDDITKNKGGEGMHLSHSSRELFIRCRYAFYLHRIKRISIRKNMMALPVKLGAIWDKYMESRYLGTKFMERFWELVDEYAIEDDMDVEKLYALIQAHRQLEMEPQYENEDGGIFRGCQHRFEFTDDGDFTVIGYIDRAYTDHIVETKLTARPDFYFQIHNITSQIGTYFLSNTEYKYALIEATRLPGLKTGKGKNSDESSESYRSRIVGEVLSKPSYYFPGYNRNKKTFGKKFWRGEFDMEELKLDYFHVNQDIYRAMEDGDGAFYKNRKACYVPGPCSYLPICSNGSVSDEIFEIRGEAESIVKEEIEEVDNE